MNLLNEDFDRGGETGFIARDLRGGGRFLDISLFDSSFSDLRDFRVRVGSVRLDPSRG